MSDNIVSKLQCDCHLDLYKISALNDGMYHALLNACYRDYQESELPRHKQMLSDRLGEYLKDIQMSKNLGICIYVVSSALKVLSKSIDCNMRSVVILNENNRYSTVGLLVNGKIQTIFDINHPLIKLLQIDRNIVTINREMNGQPLKFVNKFKSLFYSDPIIGIDGQLYIRQSDGSWILSDKSKPVNEIKDCLNIMFDDISKSSDPYRKIGEYYKSWTGICGYPHSVFADAYIDTSLKIFYILHIFKFYGYSIESLFKLNLHFDMDKLRSKYEQFLVGSRAVKKGNIHNVMKTITGVNDMVKTALRYHIPVDTVILDLADLIMGENKSTDVELYYGRSGIILYLLNSGGVISDEFMQSLYESNYERFK